MNLKMKTSPWIALVLVVSGAFAGTARAEPQFETNFYSSSGREHAVSYEAVVRTRYTDLSAFKAMSASARKSFIRAEIEPVLKFQFGPLTHRELGGPLKTTGVTVAWSKAQLISGYVEVPYRYEGVWILRKDLAVGGGFLIPVPKNVRLVYKDGWKRCTDPHPDHQTVSFLWYYWDPSRSGCDHQRGIEYEEISVSIGAQTLNEARTYPEYERLFRIKDGRKTLTLTFGFGYVEDPSRPEPERDLDPGMVEYRKFADGVWRMLRGSSLKESAILQGEYEGATDPEVRIGRRYEAVISGVDVTVNVIAAAGVDQMLLFAKSFAHDHDGLFAWLGHSRVGSGFDADQFGMLLHSYPSYYSVTDAYQVIYWGGCNSYSYYTLPFFETKGGTKNLDIIANGLPSLFGFNAMNATVVLRAFLDWSDRPSYQDIVDRIEAGAERYGVTVLTAVLGDEDNPR